MSEIFVDDSCTRETTGGSSSTVAPNTTDGSLSATADGPPEADPIAPYAAHRSAFRTVSRILYNCRRATRDDRALVPYQRLACRRFLADKYRGRLLRRFRERHRRPPRAADPVGDEYDGRLHRQQT